VGRRLLSALFAAVALAALAPGLAPAQPSERDRLQELLNDRAQAIQAGDKAAFLASVDPTAGDFVESQSAWFDRFRTIHVVDYSLQLDLDRAPEFTRAKDREKYRVPVTVALVDERYRIDGYDNRPSLNRLFLTFVFRNRTWLVASDRDLDDLGLFTSRNPWDFGTVELHRSEHFLMVVHPEDSAFASPLLRLAEQALPEVDRVWTTPWSKKVVIYVPSSNTELERIIEATFDVTHFVAFAAFSVDRKKGWESTAPRIILNRANFLRHSPAGQTRILAHELLHVATRDASGPFVSAFIEEGLAQLAEPEVRVSAVSDRILRSGKFDGTPPENVEFVSQSSEQIFLAYQEALSVAMFMRDRYGIPKLNDFYSHLGALRTEPGTDRYHLRQTVGTVFGITLSDFEREWTAYLMRRGS